jgi:hypothetical protein
MMQRKETATMRKTEMPMLIKTARGGYIAVDHIETLGVEMGVLNATIGQYRHDLSDHLTPVDLVEALKALQPVTSPAVDDVELFLRDMLVLGPLPVTELLSAAKINGYSEHDIRRAKSVLGLVVRDGAWGLPS